MKHRLKNVTYKIAIVIALVFSIQTKAQLVFTEIMFNPPESGTDSLEYIELYNSGSTSIDLNGYNLAFGGLVSRYTFTTSYIVAPASFVVFAVNANAVKRNFGLLFTPLQWNAGAGLGNSGTNIKLFSGPVSTSSVTIVDSVLYSNTWVSSAAGLGTSMSFCPSSGNNSLSTNWFSSAVNSGKIINSLPLYGSPGTLECPCTMSIVSQPSSISLCEGNTAVFTTSVTGVGLSYQWKKGTVNVGVDSPTLTLSSVVSSDASNYSVVITSTCGTLSSNTVALVVNALPTVSVNTGAICNGNSFTITPSGASSYTVSGGLSIVNPSVTTSYSVTGASTAGCVSSNTAVSTVTVNALPTVSVNTGAICNGNSFTITPSGASSYTVSGGLSVVNPSVTTSYSVTGTSTAGCVSSNTAVSTITVNALPTVSVNTGAICNGNSFTITPSGASSYTVSGGLSVVNPSVTTSYSVTGTSTAGCVSSNTAVSTVTVNALPIITIASSSSLICIGQTANLTASGAVSYTWNTSVTTSVIAVSPTVTTTYTVNGIDANGCSNFATATQNVSVCTNLEDAFINIQNSLFNVYPNPSNGIFTIELAADVKVIITNALGQEVVNNNYTEGKHLLHLQDVANGIYFVKVSVGNTQSTKRLVVNK